jgi:hypothetical protein
MICHDYNYERLFGNYVEIKSSYVCLRYLFDPNDTICFILLNLIRVP